MLRSMCKFIKNIILHCDTRPAVCACILSAYVWGFLLLLPGDVINRPYYFGLRLISTNPIFWSILFIIFGTIQLVRLIPKHENKKWIFVEYIVRFLSCSLWTYIFITAVSQYPPPPVAADTLCIIIAAWWDFLRYNGTSTEEYYKKWSSIWESKSNG